MEMSDEEKYEQALSFATKMHSGQFRIGGAPYISHPVEVAKIVTEKGFGIDYQIAALFHDLLEDTSATKEDILKYSNENVLNAVVLMTKYKGYNMADYIANIKSNDIAFEVKSADRLHNLQSAFCADLSFRKKYIKETEDWYLDFSDDIVNALNELKKSV